MDSNSDIYIIVMAVLGALSATACLCMIIVCFVFCKINHGKICDLFRVTFSRQQTGAKCQCSTKTGQSAHAYLASSKNLVKVNESYCTGTIQLLEVINNNNKDTIKLWKGNYDGNCVSVKSFKSSLHDMWTNEISFYSLPNISNEFILHYIGCQQKNNVCFYILTEYHPLGSLDNYLKYNTVNLFQALQIVCTVSLGLAHLHSSSNMVVKKGSYMKKPAIAHRDVKSANVFVKNHNGHCVLGEFSQSLFLNPNATKYAIMNLNRKRKVGTLQYMSPEALEGRMNLMDSEAFKQIDIYALALVIWEVCSKCQLNEEEPVPEYQIPFTDIVGDNPTLETMTNIVVTEKKRPRLFDIWNTNKKLERLKQMMIESWDEDPEARLTAANIASQIQSFEQRNTWIEEMTIESSTCDIRVEDSHAQHSEIIVSVSDNSSQNSNGMFSHEIAAVDIS